MVFLKFCVLIGVIFIGGDVNWLYLFRRCKGGRMLCLVDLFLVVLEVWIMLDIDKIW